MRMGWFVLLAGSFYFFVVAIFWPIEKKIFTPSQTVVERNGYQRGAVDFSDTNVQVLIPTTVATQERGLAGRTTLSDTDGMLWIFTDPAQPTFWMKGMLIPLDFVWIKSGQVVDLTINVPPPATPDAPLPIYQPSVLVDAMLEVRAGFAASHGLIIGSTVSLDPVRSGGD